MTYCELMENEPVDWLKELTTHLNENLIGSDELKRKALSWQTCACANLCSTIPRSLIGTPLDATLRQLGFAFGIAVANDRYNKAIETLHLIENRAKEIHLRVVHDVRPLDYFYKDYVEMEE